MFGQLWRQQVDLAAVKAEKKRIGEERNARAGTKKDSKEGPCVPQAISHRKTITGEVSKRFLAAAGVCALRSSRGCASGTSAGSLTTSRR